MLFFALQLWPPDSLPTLIIPPPPLWDPSPKQQPIYFLFWTLHEQKESYTARPPVTGVFYSCDDLCGLWTWWDLELPERHTSVDVCEGFLEMVLTKWNDPPCLWAPSFCGQKPHTKWKRLSKWNPTTSSLCFLCADATWPVPHVCSMPRLSWRTVLSSHEPKHALPSSSWFVGCLVTVVKTLLK